MGGAVTANTIIWLAGATDAQTCGGKAVALARARAAGLPVLPGFVLPVGLSARSPGEAGQVPGVAAAWERLSEGGARSLVVRSSGVFEDGATSSLAGRFASITDVRGWPAFVRAVDQVLASGAAYDGGMAVLVQPFLVARDGGVLFGADPVTGDERHLVLCSAAGGPVAVVSGESVGAQYTLSRRGRVRALCEGAGGARLGPEQVRELARLAGAARRTFGRPQDLEWLHDEGGALWLLQSRPVTTLGRTRARRCGPVLGPGPVAETFPDRLAPLEVDLWVEPLRRGLAEALLLSGSVAPRAVRASPVVVAVDGRVAVDLTLIEPDVGRRGLSWLDPRRPARRVRAAWRVGRLRAALPGLARAVIGDVDRLLAELPALQQLSERELLTVMRRGRDALFAVHGYEVLAGLLLGGRDAGSGLAAALRLAADGRAAGLTDEQLVERYPTVLALLPPAVRARTCLPLDLPLDPPAVVAAGTDDGPLMREALRLRTRWLQELGARAAYELALRLTARGLLHDWAEIRNGTLDALDAMVQAATPLPAYAPTGRSRPLPPTFRLTPAGVVVPAQRGAPRRGRVGARSGDGLPSGGGRAEGVVHAGPGRPADGAVLVVATMSPAYAPWLPRLAALICATGSPLSHLAILARENGVPAVLAVPDALTRFPTGTRVRVDGDTGTVDVLAAVDLP